MWTAPWPSLCTPSMTRSQPSERPTLPLEARVSMAEVRVSTEEVREAVPGVDRGAVTRVSPSTATQELAAGPGQEAAVRAPGPRPPPPATLTPLPQTATAAQALAPRPPTPSPRSSEATGSGPRTADTAHPLAAPGPGTAPPAPPAWTPDTAPPGEQATVTELPHTRAGPGAGGTPGSWCRSRSWSNDPHHLATHTLGRPHVLRSIVEIFIVPLVISLSDLTPCCIIVLFAFGSKIK